MLLYLLRHGRAVPYGAASDEERTLTPDGITALTTSLKSCRDRLPKPDRVVHSPYIRAHQSAKILGRVLEVEDRLVSLRSITPEGDPNTFLESLATAEPVNTMAVVSHEPFLGRLLALLLTGDRNGSIPMDVGMLAVVDLPSTGSWLGHLRFAKTVDF